MRKTEAPSWSTATSETRRWTSCGTGERDDMWTCLVRFSRDSRETHRSCRTASISTGANWRPTRIQNQNKQQAQSSDHEKRRATIIPQPGDLDKMMARPVRNR